MSAPDKHGKITKRSVVSSFIYKIEDGKPLVALFRRSGQVRTYKHRLAPISGSIEMDDTSPIAAAWREIREETTLTRELLTLTRQGKCYTFVDERIQREWTIYPFAFRLKTIKSNDSSRPIFDIHIDWEHEGWEWFDPLRIEDSEAFGGVPCLAESFRRVWFEKDLGEAAGAVLADGLDKLRDDYHSGARQLASLSLEVLRDVAALLETSCAVEEWWTKMRFAAWHIWKSGRESMGAAILNVLISALSGIESILTQREAHPDSFQSMKWRDTVLADLDRLAVLRQTDTSKSISRALASYLEDTFPSRKGTNQPISILTLSESSTISHSIRHLVFESGFGLDLRVLESRPLFEGVSLAGTFAEDLDSSPKISRPQDNHDSLARKPLTRISLYTDAAVALASHNVDIVVLGADRIASNGAVSNKTGSLPAVLSAKHVTSASGRPASIILLGETEKIAPPERPEAHVIEDNAPKQVTQAWQAEYNSNRVRHASKSLAGIQDQHGHSLLGDELSHRAVEVAIYNVAFEWCPPELIDVYMTEHGPWGVDDISKHSEQLGDKQQRLFGSL